MKFPIAESGAATPISWFVSTMRSLPGDRFSSCRNSIIVAGPAVEPGRANPAVSSDLEVKR